MAGTYDVRCDALARVFLGDCGSFTEDEVATLASDVQRTIEDFIEARPSAVASEPKAGHVSCYVCGCCVPEDAYFSDRRTDSGPVVGVDGHVWGDAALVLCETCATRGEAMQDAEAFAFYASGQHWTKEKKAPGRGRTLDHGFDVAVTRGPLSNLGAGVLSYHTGRMSALGVSPEPGSIEWVIEKLADRESPGANDARDPLINNDVLQGVRVMLTRAFAEERAAISLREAKERAKQRPHARYEVTFTLELDDDDGSSESDVEEAVQSILDEAMRPADGEEWVVRDGLCLYDTLDVSAKFDETVTP